MAEETSKPPIVVEQIPSVVGSVSAIASANAPFIYFDHAPNFGLNDGIANITLEVVRFGPAANGVGVIADRVTVAHLRMGLRALSTLKSAIEGIEQLAQPVPEGVKN